MATVSLSIRVDKDMKAECEALYTNLGMDLTTAVTLFLHRSLRDGGLPFELRCESPSKATIVAMLEAERLAVNPRTKRFSDMDKMLQELKK